MHYFWKPYLYFTRAIENCKNPTGFLYSYLLLIQNPRGRHANKPNQVSYLLGIMTSQKKIHYNQHTFLLRFMIVVRIWEFILELICCKAML